MALYNLAGFKTATLGVADVVFSAPITALNTFPLAGVPNGATVTYMLENFDGGGNVDAREVGRGTWNSGTLTLARTTVVDSTNGGAKIVLGGNAEVRITAIAQDFSAAAVGAPALVTPSVAGNFVSFSNTTGGQADSGVSAASFQPIDATLTSIAALGTAANKMIYTTGVDTWAEADLSAFARTFLDDANAAAVRATIGAGTGNGDLLSTNNLSDLINAATARTNLGLGAAALLAVPITAANGGTGIANGASATLTLPNLAIALGGGGAAQTYTLPAAGGTFALLNAANVFTVNQFIDGSADAIQLRVQGHSTQTANLQTWEDSTAAVLLSVGGTGKINQLATSTDHTVTPHNLLRTTLTIGTEFTNGSTYAYQGAVTVINTATISAGRTLGGMRFVSSINDSATNAFNGTLIGGIFRAQQGSTSSISLAAAIGGDFEVNSQSNRASWIATTAVAGRFNVDLQSNAAHTTAAAYSALLTTHVKNASITITTGYGLYVEAMTVAGTNYAIYTNAGLVRFGDAVDIASSLRVDSIVNDTGLAAGTYTPTRSAEANMDANVTMTEAQYMRVGNTVTVSGRFTADPTLPATTTSFEITLPVASNIGAVEDLAGTAFCGNIAGMGAEVTGSVANNTAVITWKSSDTTSQSWSYTFTYQVI